MSAARRRARRRRPGEGAPADAAQADAAPRGAAPLAEWKWRTFPVFFALSLGLFVGSYAGLAGAAAATDGDDWPYYIVSIPSALLLGFGLSRLVVRWLITRRIIKPRPGRRRR